MGRLGGKAKESRLRLFGHVRGRDKEYISKRMQRTAISGKKKRGSLERRNLNEIKKDMMETGSTEKDALNGTNWRKKVRCGIP